MNEVIGWPKSQQVQSIAIRVSEWQSKLFVDHGGRSEELFQFDGSAIGGDIGEGLLGRRTLGHFENSQALREGEQHEMVGHFKIYKIGVLSLPREMDALCLTLYGDASRFDQLFRLFSAFSAMPTSRYLRLELAVTHADWQSRDFWTTDWRGRDLRVVEYGLHCGGLFGCTASEPQFSS